MTVSIGLKEPSRTQVIDRLARVLADLSVLSLKTRNFHWNVTGPGFSELHKFFEAQYSTLEGEIDETAERSRTLGGRALGSMKEMLAHARLRETGSGRSLSSDSMLGELLKDHEMFIRALRADVDACGDAADKGTEDFLVGMMETHEKMAWMLRAFIS